MNNLYVTSRGLIKIDETGAPVIENNSRLGIDGVLLIKEPTHIVYKRSNKEIELNAEPGDILIYFYDSTFDTPIVLVHSEDWANNIREYDRKEQERKEKWAAEAAKRAESNIETEE
jgi:hypothetical protein